MDTQLIVQARQLKARAEFIERAAIRAMAEVDQMYAERSDALDQLNTLVESHPELAKALAIG